MPAMQSVNLNIEHTLHDDIRVETLRVSAEVCRRWGLLVETTEELRCN